MAIIITVKDADWSGKGFPNINPFIAGDDLLYGFDFTDRPDKFVDITGVHTVTPHLNNTVDPVVPDASVAVTTSDGLGVILQQGALVSDVPIPTVSHNSEPFTIMVVAADSGEDSDHTGAVLFSMGYGVSTLGVGITRLLAGGANIQVESGAPNLNPMPNTTSKLQPTVLFLSYDGTTTWTVRDMSTGGTASGTNAELGVLNPMSMHKPFGKNSIILGGNTGPTTEVFANYPVIYQQAMWGKVLSEPEMLEQYERSKSMRPYLAL